jgi:uncharacterized protein (DUF1015 family)
LLRGFVQSPFLFLAKLSSPIYLAEVTLFLVSVGLLGIAEVQDLPGHHRTRKRKKKKKIHLFRVTNFKTHPIFKPRRGVEMSKNTLKIMLGFVQQMFMELLLCIG